MAKNTTKPAETEQGTPPEAEAKATTETQPAKPRRRQRTIDERIAELEARRDAQAARRRKVVQRNYEEAVRQRDNAKVRLERSQAAVDKLSDELASLPPAKSKD